MSDKIIRVNAVVNFILEKSKHSGTTITNLKLQKLLFFVNGFYYYNNSKLLFNADMLAWQYGPVIPEIYYEFKRFGSRPIKDTFSCVYEPSEMEDVFIPRLEEKLHKDEIKYIEATFNLLAGKPTGYLVDLSHKKNSPWSSAKNNKDQRIELRDSDKDYFKEVFEEITSKYE